MSRSGYSEDFEGETWELICWRGAVASAIRGKRGQAFLKEMLATLDKLETKRLISRDLIKDGEVCAIGSVGKARGVDMSGLEPENPEGVAETFGVSPALVKEIVWWNDEGGSMRETPEERYARMRLWVERHIADAANKASPK